MNILGCKIEHSGSHVHIHFDAPRPVLSSAVLKGGYVHADSLVNLKVQGRGCRPEDGLHTPEEVIADHCRIMRWTGRTVGMMTAASMKSLRIVMQEEGPASVAALITSGLSNARCAGDTADCRTLTMEPELAGTINVVLVTNLNLTPAAMVEAIAVATEAKASVLQSAGVKSRVSSNLATGTGTDSVAIVCKGGGPAVKYCGKHVLVGELIGRSVKQALEESIQWDLEHE